MASIRRRRRARTHWPSSGHEVGRAAVAERSKEMRWELVTLRANEKKKTTKYEQGDSLFLEMMFENSLRRIELTRKDREIRWPKQCTERRKRR